MNSWLANLDSILRTQFPTLPRPGGEQPEVKALEKLIPVGLPEVYKQFLAWCPAQVEISFSSELPDAISGQMVPLAEAVAVLKDWAAPSPPGTFLWWHPGWVPFLGSADKEYWCVDTVGVFGNPVSSVVQFLPDNPGRKVYFPNFEGWVRWLVLSLEQGLGRAFYQDGRLDLVMGRKATALVGELYPDYPADAEAQMLGLGFMNRVLNVMRKSGLQINCTLPPFLSPEELGKTLHDGLLREEGADNGCVRVSGLWQNRETMQGWALYVLLRPTPKNVSAEALVAVPENADLAITSALGLQSNKDLVGASRRYTEAAYHCHQAGCLPEALALLGWALQMDPANAVATRSLQNLQPKQPDADARVLRPLLLHVGAAQPLP